MFYINYKINFGELVVKIADELLSGYSLFDIVATLEDAKSSEHTLENECYWYLVVNRGYSTAAIIPELKEDWYMQLAPHTSVEFISRNLKECYDKMLTEGYHFGAL